MYNIAIVITAYNRSKSLDILLKSLNKMYVKEETTLIISIDNGGTEEVNKVANDYVWKHGRKEVFIHKARLGLVKHFIWAGDQTDRFDNVIFLEDDLYVSPELMEFSTQLIDFYTDDPDVAAASLYNPPLCEATGCKFYQIQDGYDVYFFQQPYWGNIWFKEKWSDFLEYFKTYKEKKDILPYNIANWKKSFKKIYIQYLIENNKYVVTPRISLLTNMGEVGLHNSISCSAYQTPVLIGHKRYSFCKSKESLSRYDAFWEIDPSVLKKLNSKIEKYDFCVNINGIRKIINTQYILAEGTSNNPLMIFSSRMIPSEMSVIFDVNDIKGLTLCKKSDIKINKINFIIRRFNDIKKNYHIGINASVCMIFYLFKRVIQIVVSFIMKLLKN